VEVILEGREGVFSLNAVIIGIFVCFMVIMIVYWQRKMRLKKSNVEIQFLDE